MDDRLTFFPKQKVRVLLDGWSPKNNREGEKRIRLDFQIPLIDDARGGVIPGWIFNTLRAMEDSNSKESASSFDIVLDGLTIEVFDTPKSPERTHLLTAATLDGFTLKRVSRDKQTYIALAFNTNVKRDKALLLWADKYEACFVWAEFTPADPSVPSKPVPGAQMTIADASANEGAKGEVSPDQSQENIKAFFTPGGGVVLEVTPTKDELLAEAQAEVNAIPVETTKSIAGFDPTKKGQRKKQTRADAAVN